MGDPPVATCCAHRSDDYDEVLHEHWAKVVGASSASEQLRAQAQLEARWAVHAACARAEAHMMLAATRRERRSRAHKNRRVRAKACAETSSVGNAQIDSAPGWFDWDALEAAEGSVDSPPRCPAAALRVAAARVAVKPRHCTLGPMSYRCHLPVWVPERWLWLACASKQKKPSRPPPDEPPLSQIVGASVLSLLHFLPGCTDMQVNPGMPLADMVRHCEAFAREAAGLSPVVPSRATNRRSRRTQRRCGYAGIRVGEASHPGPDRQFCSWVVSVKPTAASSCCQSPACRGPIEKGHLRACRAGVVNQRWYHIECVEGGLGPSDTVAGLEELSTEQRERAIAFCDDDARGRRRADYVEHAAKAKRRKAGCRVQEDPPPELDPPELAGGDDNSEVLKNLCWWNTVQWGDLRRWVPTMASVPSSTHHAVARLKRAVLLERLDARDQGEETRCARAWKIITFLDRLLFSLPRQRGEETNASRVTRRVREAWRGNWQGLWEEAQPSFGQRGVPMLSLLPMLAPSMPMLLTGFFPKLWVEPGVPPPSVPDRAPTADFSSCSLRAPCLKWGLLLFLARTIGKLSSLLPALVSPNTLNAPALGLQALGLNTGPPLKRTKKLPT